MSDAPGFSAEAARAFVQAHLEKSAAHTQFFWESAELEEAVDLLVDAMAQLVAANNRKVADDMNRAFRTASLY